MATSTQEWIEELKGISVLELAERIKALEEEFGVSAAAEAPAEAEAEEEEDRAEPEAEPTAEDDKQADVSAKAEGEDAETNPTKED